jgi:hypothetical protein
VALSARPVTELQLYLATPGHPPGFPVNIQHAR